MFFGSTPKNYDEAKNWIVPEISRNSQRKEFIFWEFMALRFFRDLYEYYEMDAPNPLDENSKKGEEHPFGINFEDINLKNLVEDNILEYLN